MAQIEEMWTDQIVELGAVRRIYFRLLVDDAGTRTWHYFGTTQVEKPPHGSYDAVVEYDDVQLPADIQHMAPEAGNEALFQLGLQCGAGRESLDIL